MDGWVGLVRVAQVFDKCLHAAQVELLGRVARRARQAVVDKAVQVVEGVLVVGVEVHWGGIVPSRGGGRQGDREEVRS